MNLKNNKAPGHDGVNNILLKNLPDIAIEFLKNIINVCLKICYFPRALKKAKVICIQKHNKDQRLPSSYRPISLLSSIEKLFEKIILARINTHIIENNIINKEQFGFRPQHSTVHQIKRITKIIKTNKRLKLSTGMVLMDIEKAFDSIWHNGLLYKLNQFKFPFYIIKIIQAFLTDRSFNVTLNNAVSTDRNIPAGVPQGAVLSPTLYSIYIADFKTKSNCEVAFYADDSAIIAKGKNSNTLVKRLEKGLEASKKYYKKWKININVEKTQAIIFPFNKSPKRTPNCQLQNDNNIIPLNNHVKYLGVTLDSKLTFRKHIESTADKTNKCLRAVYPLLSKKSVLSNKNKIIIYKTVIRPIMLYACNVWHIAAKTHLKKLQIVQNKALKAIHKLPRRFPTLELHEKFHHSTISSVINQHNSSFNERCRSSVYDLIQELAE